MALTNTRIELLKRREKEIRASLAIERAKSQRRADRETAFAAKIVGKAAIDMAARDPEGFGVTLKRILDISLTDEKRARNFLRQKGLL